MKLEKGLLGAVLLASSMVLSACGQGEVGSGATGDHGDGTYAFKLSHVTQESHVWHATAKKFDEELRELSDGRMSLQIYPAAQLGAEQDMVQQLSNGTIEFGFLTNAYMSTREESLNA